ncbi:MAG: hypothetical protein V2A73_21825, partial [Pseudomonadota bacterium]
MSAPALVDTAPGRRMSSSSFSAEPMIPAREPATPSVAPVAPVAAVAVAPVAADSAITSSAGAGSIAGASVAAGADAPFGVASVLGPGSALARAFPGYERRPQQLAMAAAVGAALVDEMPLLVEAG